MTQQRRETKSPLPTKETAAALMADPIFDTDFYSRTYMLKETADRVTAAAHFMAHGTFDLRPTSLELDPIAYMNAHPDVEASGLHPSIHYAAYGRKEGRAIERLNLRPAASAITLAELRAELQPETDLASKRAIAITAHIFYEDYVSYLLNFLARMPYRFDLFVSVPNPLMEARARSFSALPNIGKLTVEVVPNKGRNFLGFFSRFAKRLLKYDYIAHVHSKKSLYTGSARTDWGLFYVSGVLGSPDHIRSALQIFERDPSVGTISADRHYKVPYWAAHWLRNFGIGKQLAERLQVGAINEGFIDYPIGGMFWARTSAIKPLLELGLSDSDFPEELGQTDGTIQHALERLIGVVPAANGFRNVKYSAREGRYILDVDLWRHDYTVTTKNIAYSLIDRSNVVSFDLFDTLVLRDAADPDEAKCRVTETSAGWNEGLGEYRKIRNDAELSIRKEMAFKGDVRLQDVVVKIADTSGVSMISASTAVTAEAKIDLELFRRRETVIAMYEYAKRKNKRVLVVSDTYYPASFVTQIFAKLGISLPNEIYLSCERQVRKDTGELWDLVKHNESTSSGFIHFGDNVVSDVQNLADRGLDGVFVCKATEKLHLLKILERQPDRRSWPIVSSLVLKFGDDPFFG